MDEHLENIREDREHYRYTHPDDIAEIAQQFDLYLQGAVATER